jgi:senataxin
MIDANPDVRMWAKAQSSKSQIVPIPLNKFHKAYRAAVEAIAGTLASIDSESYQASSTSLVSDPSIRSTGMAAFGASSFATNPADLWSAFGSVLRFIPPDLFTTKYHHSDIRRIVTGHLHDVGPRQSFFFYLVLNLI